MLVKYVPFLRDGKSLVSPRVTSEHHCPYVSVAEQILTPHFIKQLNLSVCLFSSRPGMSREGSLASASRPASVMSTDSSGVKLRTGVNAAKHRRARPVSIATSNVMSTSMFEQRTPPRAAARTSHKRTEKPDWRSASPSHFVFRLQSCCAFIAFSLELTTYLFVELYNLTINFGGRTSMGLFHQSLSFRNEIFIWIILSSAPVFRGSREATRQQREGRRRQERLQRQELDRLHAEHCGPEDAGSSQGRICR